MYGYRSYIGEGFAIGIEQTARMVRKATESIVSIPNAQSFDGYGFRMDGVSNVNSTTYDFNSNQSFTFNSTLTLDGRTLAKASNRYTEEELNKSAKFKDRIGRCCLMLYGFRDTTDTSGVLGSNLPSEAMNFNGKFLENEINGYRTLTVSGRELIGSEF